MIITVTPNPALDRTYQLDLPQVGEVNRAQSFRVDAGGKGINIARALQAHHYPTVAIFPSAEPAGAELSAALGALGVPATAVPVAGETRTNITLVDSGGVTTKINGSGAPLLPDAEAALLGAVKASATQAASLVTSGKVLDPLTTAPGPATAIDRLIIVGAGSLPTGTDPEFYAKLIRLGFLTGADVAIDTSGPPLAWAVKAGGLAVVKPNLSELTELVGGTLHTVGEVVTAARKILAFGNHAVLVSLGADGALLVWDDTWAWAGGPPLIPRSTVGAGDMALAGYLSVIAGGGAATADADGSPVELRALKTAVTWGRAAVLQPGTSAPAPSDLQPEQVSLIVQPELTIPLAELTSLPSQ